MLSLFFVRFFLLCLYSRNSRKNFASSMVVSKFICYTKIGEHENETFVDDALYKCNKKPSKVRTSIQIAPHLLPSTLLGLACCMNALT